MLLLADLGHGLIAKLYHMETVVDDLFLGEWNALFGYPHVGRTHVHGDGLNGLDLLLRKLGETSHSSIQVMPITDGFDGTLVQVVDHRDVVACSPKTGPCDMWESSASRRGERTFQ